MWQCYVYVLVTVHAHAERADRYRPGRPLFQTLDNTGDDPRSGDVQQACAGGGAHQGKRWAGRS